jgi:hypothetical protein
MKIINPVAYKQRDFLFKARIAAILNKQNTIVQTVLIFVLCKKQIPLASLILATED